MPELVWSERHLVGFENRLKHVDRVKDKVAESLAVKGRTVAEAMKLIPDGGRRDEAFTQDLVWQRSSLLISAERGDLENEFIEITAEQADEIANRIRQSASIKPVP